MKIGTILRATPESINPWGIYFRDSEKHLFFAHMSDHTDILIEVGFSGLAKIGEESIIEILRVIEPGKENQFTEPLYVVRLRQFAW